MPDLQNQVAKMPCPDDAHSSRLEAGEGCVPCKSTGLRWPELSRECYTPEGILDCLNFSLDHHHGRVPDVTLEKMLPLLNIPPGCLLGGNAEGWFTGSGHEYFDTPLDAACAALLESEK